MHEIRQFKCFWRLWITRLRQCKLFTLKKKFKVKRKKCNLTFKWLVSPFLWFLPWKTFFTYSYQWSSLHRWNHIKYLFTNVSFNLCTSFPRDFFSVMSTVLILNLLIKSGHRYSLPVNVNKFMVRLKRFSCSKYRFDPLYLLKIDSNYNGYDLFLFWFISYLLSATVPVWPVNLKDHFHHIIYKLYTVFNEYFLCNILNSPIHLSLSYLLFLLFTDDNNHDNIAI